MRNWHPWVKLGVHEISAPMSFHSRVKLDYPVSLGGYRHARDPSEPMCLHLVHVPQQLDQGRDARERIRVGRYKLLAMEFADFEMKIRDELDRMLGAGGFSAARDIAAITVNRWSHGYSYSAEFVVRHRRYRHDPAKRQGVRSAASRSPIPMPSGMPTPMPPSIRQPARCANC